MNKKTRAAVLLLLALGIALRVYGAWASRIITDPDTGIVALMAKHMSEGRHFPLFFYGQAYMGTLEPALSALFCLLLGCSGFAVNLGTVCFGAAFLVSVFLWAREAGGTTAGIAALAYCAIGPAAFFYFQFIPRGGYPAALFFATLTIWLSVRIAARPEIPRMRMVLLLGLTAGLAWWTTPITTAALLAAGLVLLIRFRLRLFSWRMLAPGLLGFALGSTPFWIWNFLNDWTSLDFITHSGGGNFLTGCEHLATRFGGFLGYGMAPSGLFYSGLLLYAVAVAAAVVLALRKQSEASTRYALFATLAYPFLSALLYVQSRFAEFNTLRYFQPFVAPLAVIVGTGTARLAKKWPYGLGWAPLLVLLVIQLPALNKLPESARLSRRKMEEGEALSAFLREHGTKAVYANFVYYAMNFQLKEEFCFSQVSGEHYEPYKQRMELADRIAMLGNHGGGAEFLATSGGTSHTERVGRHLLTYDFQPPAGGLAEIDSSRISRATGSSENSDAALLADGNLNTFWTLGESGDPNAWVEFQFDRPVEIALIRVICQNRDTYPEHWRIKGQTEQGRWKTLLPLQPVTTLFWSGPRPFVHGEIHRIEARFAPEKIVALKMECRPDPRTSHTDISEIQLFAPDASTPTSEASALPELLRRLEERKVTRVYADRWMANRVHTETGGRIAASLDPDLFDTDRKIEHPAMELDPHTVLLVRRENVPLCRRVLAQCEVKMHEEEIAPWVLFYFEPGDWAETYRENIGLQWAGISCLVGDSKRHALLHYGQALETYRREGPSPKALDHLRNALTLYPTLTEPRWRLLSWAREAGSEQEALQFLSQTLHQAVPRYTARIGYKNGIEFLGFSPSTNKVTPGGLLGIRYYWRCPPSVRNMDYAVFVHFMNNDKIGFQDDHILLSRKSRQDLSYQPCDEVFITDRAIRLPNDLAEGEYSIRIGLLKLMTHTRLKPSTSLEVQSRAVTLPATVIVKRTETKDSEPN